jgi:hypothetical protein
LATGIVIVTVMLTHLCADVCMRVTARRGNHRWELTIAPRVAPQLTVLVQLDKAVGQPTLIAASAVTVITISAIASSVSGRLNPALLQGI